MTKSSPYELRQQLRQTMRALRLSLTPVQQTFAAQQIIPKALTLIEHYQATRLAFYLPFNGEISPIPLIERLQTLNKKIYLPVLHPFSAHQLLFLEYHSPQDLETNRFGILQPKLDVRNVLPLNELEMIFVPLVACDQQGNRLGMGGGFYDRTLAQAKHLVSVGLAHRNQQVEQLPVESWDEPLTHLILGDCE
ncbi:5-formyltetrahydrofolate cyclo-ligase [Glaesserella sp.]|uniref:5-formyltetrahydrofolate cyclo-ligase n=1 Tax=Glaesserella sp. TaxID=2094731 RepID=UPI00359F3E20